MTIIVTGAAGFIGSNFVLDWFNNSCGQNIISFDLLTYAGNLENIKELEGIPEHLFIKGNILDRNLILGLLKKFNVTALVNFAAESHVDRSIKSPDIFIDTNISGTFNLLEACRLYLEELSANDQQKFRFIHISTDEVYGALKEEDAAFKEDHQYQPNSPYSASKAASDHLVRAWYHTYNVPAITTNCSNNYGPYHFPEKLIPLCILNALDDRPLPIYGDGKQIRDWLYVKDHCSAIREILNRGRPGETYNIGGWNEKTNIEVVETLCKILDELKPKANGKSYRDQITYVKDRPGHDRRYAIDSSKLKLELGWEPKETFESGLRKTIIWFLEHQNWVNNVVTGEYQYWVQKQYS